MTERDKKIHKSIDFLEGFTDDERIEARGELLALHFLSVVDHRMLVLDMSKKELANKVGTSTAYITQLFRGNKTPNWKMLAKMEKAVGVRFMISAELESKEARPIEDRDNRSETNPVERTKIKATDSKAKGATMPHAGKLKYRKYSKTKNVFPAKVNEPIPPKQKP